MDKDNNFKKLLCYNIVNNINCVYKQKCMFAHNIDDQKKEPIREFIYKMIYQYNNLSNININDNKELFEELLIFTKECKNCINKKCPGGYNCKFGVCLKELKICYNDLLYGKCNNLLIDNNTLLNPINIIIENQIIKRCVYGIHLTEKNLIPYYQRISNDINMLDCGSYLYDNINYYSKINTISLLLNDKTILIVNNLINKKFNKYDNFKNIFNNSDINNNNKQINQFMSNNVNNLIDDLKNNNLLFLENKTDNEIIINN